jgi:hypothetical protein
MKNNKIIAIMMTLSMLAAAFAGCLSDDTDNNFDEVDGGYEYASNVDNHRMLVEDVCDIKDLAEAHDWDGVKDIYMNGKHAEKNDGSYRTLQGFADATGKQHGLDTFYGTDSPLDDYLMSALDGTGMFAGASDSVREQAVEKGVQNQIMVAYAIHELNAAINKAAAGNFGTDDAQHAWDEGWAFYHGLDEYASCSPYATGDKRAGNYATANADGTAVANAAILQAMNDGLTALKAEDLEGATAARDDIVKNLVIIYSQATIRYAHKMNTDDTIEKAQTHQAEGYSFWRVIEKYIAEANPSPGDDCYNGVTMTVSAAAADECAGYMYMTDYDMGDGSDICYNMNTHTVSADTDENSCLGYMFLENYGEQTYTGCYNSASHDMNSSWNQSICESWDYYDNASWGSTTFTGCYNMVSHETSSDDNATCISYMWVEDYVTVAGQDGCYNSVSHSWDTAVDQTTCESYGWYVNYVATIFTGCYNMVSHTTDADMTEAECSAFTHFDGFGTTGINGIYDFNNVPVAGTDYQAAVRAHLQPAWDMLGITAEDIGTLQ